MPQQIKHFGTSGEIATLVQEVNAWLNENDGKLEVITVSESQGGRIGDEADPFYYCINITYRTT